jgi:hypothetical protein
VTETLGSTGLRFQVGPVSLVVEGGVGHRLHDHWLGRLSRADLVALTGDLLWAQMTVSVGDTSFDLHAPILDVVQGWTAAADRLTGTPKAVYRSSEGTGDFTFTHQNGLVLIAMDRGPKASMAYSRFRPEMRFGERANPDAAPLGSRSQSGSRRRRRRATRGDIIAGQRRDAGRRPALRCGRGGAVKATHVLVRDRQELHVIARHRLERGIVLRTTAGNGTMCA